MRLAIVDGVTRSKPSGSPRPDPVWPTSQLTPRIEVEAMDDGARMAQVTGPRGQRLVRYDDLERWGLKKAYRKARSL